MPDKNKRERRETMERLIAQIVENHAVPIVPYPNTVMHSIVVYVIQNHIRQFTSWINEVAEDDESLSIQDAKKILYSMHEITHAASDMEILKTELPHLHIVEINDPKYPGPYL